MVPAKSIHFPLRREKGEKQTRWGQIREGQDGGRVDGWVCVWVGAMEGKVGMGV